jgi:hypothetical protein
MPRRPEWCGVRAGEQTAETDVKIAAIIARLGVRTAGKIAKTDARIAKIGVRTARKIAKTDARIVVTLACSPNNSSRYRSLCDASELRHAVPEAVVPNEVGFSFTIPRWPVRRASASR